MTNFFEQQQIARKNTRLLLLAMVLSVFGIATALWLAFELALGASNRYLPLRAVEPPSSGLVFLVLLVSVSLLVVIASGVRAFSLRSGGVVVAEMLGGRRIDPGTRDPAERRLVNVVEEMAIASSCPVPSVFVLDEEHGINAFAAGHTPEDAAVAVTRGALDSFTRDELQGVIAHEFSHILNGDMRLNLRLMGTVFGITCIALLGRVLFRALLHRGSSRSRSKNGQAVLAGVMVAAVLWLIGSLGELCARIIKAAISRQREFLADASAVQFTRNPLGLRAALERIGGAPLGSLVTSTRAEEASHFFFSDAIVHKLGGVLATHPSLAERIARLDPAAAALTQGAAVTASFRDRALPEQAFAFAPATVADHVGAVQPVHIVRAQALLEALPPHLREATASAFPSVALVVALVLAPKTEVRARQHAAIRATFGAALVREAERLQPAVAGLAPELRLPLVELCARGLGQLSTPQARSLVQLLDALCEADAELSAFELVLTHLVRRKSASQAAQRDPATRNAGAHKRLASVREQVLVVLSVLAHAGCADASAAEQAFRNGWHALDPHARAVPSLLLKRASLVSGLGLALEELARATPELRERIVLACAHTVLSDRAVRSEEAELLRSVCEAIASPLPPFLVSAANSAQISP